MTLEAHPVLVLPIGAYEQHGAHLPLDTDTRIATAIAQLALLRCQSSDFVLAPALPISASDEHQGFNGTLSAGTHATQEFLVAVCRSATWSRGVVLVNGHGGNADALQSVHYALDDERITHAIWSVTGAAITDTHAGHFETSIMLHLFPELVQRDTATIGNTTALDQLMPTMRKDGLRAVSLTGVLGDPTTATAVDGGVFVEQNVLSLTQVLRHCASTWNSSS
ncbi:MAG: mycofactocin biosynthesis peptidyl-dipeptidase MftE [Ilumatobacteraceae bacterium]|nr:mycofactocin biosynthesis peptidyl-dipeptidase MftE [Ilumatobacteraceae bacterium]